MDLFERNLLRLLFASEEFRNGISRELKLATLPKKVEDYLSNQQKKVQQHHWDVRDHRRFVQQAVHPGLEKWEEVANKLHSDARKAFGGQRGGGQEFDEGLEGLFVDVGVDKDKAAQAAQWVAQQLGSSDEIGFYGSAMSGRKPEGYEPEEDKVKEEHAKMREATLALDKLSKHFDKEHQKAKHYLNGPYAHKDNPEHHKAVVTQTLAPHIHDMAQAMGQWAPQATRAYDQSQRLDKSEKELHPEIAEHMKTERHKQLSPEEEDREDPPWGSFDLPDDVSHQAWFDKFLREEYGREGGKTKIRNTNPKTKDKYPDVEVNTLLKGDENFRRQVLRAFELWRRDL